MTLDERFDRLLDALLRGKVVPFLGAGISCTARATGGDPPPLAAGKVARLLLTAARAAQPADAARQLHVTSDGNVELRGGAPHDPAKDPHLGEVAEYCRAHLGAVKTVDITRIHEWREFYAPTPAHHYLAMLVREGLLTEVLETNYDEFVEEAVRQTFGGAPPDDAVVVLADRASYAEGAATPRDDREHKALLRLVKLNGCARAWRDKRATPDRQAAAEEILLTEAQLQGWAGKAWARDLLQDRVRSRTLLFIGFAGQDPIVRHHALSVIRELTGDHHGNAPWVAAYDPELSFYQHQILRAPFGDTAESLRLAYNHAFLGGDAAALDPTKRGLEADLFLETLATTAVCRKVARDVFGPDGPLAQYLQGGLRYPRPIVQAVGRRLLPPTPTATSPLKEALRLPEAATAPGVSGWARLVATLAGTTPSAGLYRPFLGNEVQLGLIVLLLEWFGGWGEPVSAGLKLWGASGRGLPLYATLNLDAFLDGADESCVVLLLGQGHKPAFRRTLWRDGGCHEVVAIGDLAALRGRGALPESRQAIVRNLERICEAPELALEERRNWRETYAEAGG